MVNNPFSAGQGGDSHCVEMERSRRRFRCVQSPALAEAAQAEPALVEIRNVRRRAPILHYNHPTPKKISAHLTSQTLLCQGGCTYRIDFQNPWIRDASISNKKLSWRERRHWEMIYCCCEKGGPFLHKKYHDENRTLQVDRGGLCSDLGFTAPSCGALCTI